MAKCWVIGHALGHGCHFMVAKLWALGSDWHRHCIGIGVGVGVDVSCNCHTTAVLRELEYY